MARGLAIALLCLLLPALPARAHLLNMTQATATIDADGEMTLQLSLDLLRASGSAEAYYRLSRAADPLRDPAFAAQWRALADGLELRQGAVRVPLTPVAVTPPAGASLEDFASAVTWPMTGIELRAKLDPVAPMTLRFRSSFAFEEPVSLTLVADGGARKMSRLLVANQLSTPFPPVSSSVAPARQEGFDFWHHLGVGILHILPGGVDHLLFLLCLFLLARGWRWLLLYASVFTLAHSVTLILASYRLVEVPAGIVEALIAGSILWLAIAVLAGRHAHASLGLIGAFGLLHGLGFANALRALPLDDHQFLLTLVTFNVGVEVGQMIFLGALWLALAWCRGRPWYAARVMRPLAVAVALVSSAWLVQRLASL